MIHCDYTWDLYPAGIVLDEELNVDRLGWKEGDYFKMVIINGKRMIKKIDELELFIVKGVESNER